MKDASRAGQQLYGIIMMLIGTAVAIRLTDRELMERSGLSKMGVTGGKRWLRETGLLLLECDKTRPRIGTLYRRVDVGQTTGQNLAQESRTVRGAIGGAITPILSVTTQQDRERDAHVREQESGTVRGAIPPELETILAVWRENRGRPLIEREVNEMAQWRAKLGEGELIRRIEAAWDQCTAEHMSMHYMRLFVEKKSLGDPGAPGAKGKKPGAKKNRSRLKRKLQGKFKGKIQGKTQAINHLNDEPNPIAYELMEIAE